MPAAGCFPQTSWTSWALGRLEGLAPPALADLVRRRAGLPDTTEAREVVGLHLAALDVSLDLGSPDLFVHQLRWELTRWPHVAPGSPSVAAAVRSVLEERLDELTLAAVVRHVGAAESGAATLEGRAWADRGWHGLSGLTPLGQTHLGLALAGRHDEAATHVAGLVADGTPVPEVLLEVIVPAQREVGRLWERGALTAAQEREATAVTRTTLSTLSAITSPAGRSGRGPVLVAASAPGDLHDLGPRIVAGLLQARGWQARYADPAASADDVVEAVVASGATLLLLGASMTAHLPSLRQAVGQVRADPRCGAVTVLVGGEPFRHAPGLGEWVGADLVATQGVDVLRAAAGLVGTERTAGL